MDRFRPNIVIIGGDPHFEDRLGEFQIGSCVMNVYKHTSRCNITQTDQQTAEVQREPLWTLATYRKVKGDINFGSYATLGKGLNIKVGDKIFKIKDGPKLYDYGKYKLENNSLQIIACVLALILAVFFFFAK